MKIYDADCQKQAIRYITENYLKAPTRRGCFFLVGQYGSGKSWVMRKLASQYVLCVGLIKAPINSSVDEHKAQTYGVGLINLNLYLAQSLQREPDFDKLIRFNSKKINTLFRGYLKRLFETKLTHTDSFDLLLVDNIELLHEYDVDFINTFNSLCINANAQQSVKCIVSIPATVSDGYLYPFDNQKIRTKWNEFMFELKVIEL